MRASREQELFEKSGVVSAILRLALPTVAGQIILVLYNMADTFFVARTGSDAMLTAVTVCMPAFMILSAISNLFGIGGASVISRALGAGSMDRVRRASAFALYGCVLVTLLYSLVTFLACDPLVDLLGGTDAAVHGNAAAYLICTVSLGGVMTAAAGLLSHLLRAVGRASCAGAGIALGGILNIALDPLFMFVLLPPGNEALGAAVATALSNAISLLFFVAALIRTRRTSPLAFRFSRTVFYGKIPADVLSAGFPACVMTLLENVSYAVLDKLMSLSGVQLQAGLGIAKKINMLAHCIVRGIAQGALPMIGYNYSAGHLRRMRSSVRVSRLLSLGAAAACTAAYLAFSRELTGIFIRHGSSSLDYGTAFLRILCVGGPFSAVAYTTISFFQAVGEGRRSFFLAILRKGLVDIPLMFLLMRVSPTCGIVSATPITDALCCAAACVMLALYIRKLPDTFGKEDDHA